MNHAMQALCGLTLEFTRGRKQAKPAVARRVQRRVMPSQARRHNRRSAQACPDARASAQAKNGGSTVPKRCIATSRTGREPWQAAIRASARRLSAGQEGDATNARDTVPQCLSFEATRARTDEVGGTDRARIGMWKCCGITFELSRVRRPQAVARRLERRVRRRRGLQAISERLWPVLYEPSDLATDHSEERDWLSGLRSVRDAHLGDGRACRCDEAIDAELPATCGWVFSIHSGEVLPAVDTLLRLGPLHDELLRENGSDRAEIIGCHEAPELADNGLSG
jgi:hypothetical protein